MQAQCLKTRLYLPLLLDVKDSGIITPGSACSGMWCLGWYKQCISKCVCVCVCAESSTVGPRKLQKLQAIHYINYTILHYATILRSLGTPASFAGILGYRLAKSRRHAAPDDDHHDDDDIQP